MAKKNTVFHIGGKEWKDEALLSELSDSFDYQWLPHDYDFSEDTLELKILKAGIFNKKYDRALFLIEGVPEFIQKAPQMLVQFPAYQIFCEEDQDFSAEAKRLLTIKGAYAVDFKRPERIIHLFKTNYVGGQMGYKMEDLFVQGPESSKIKVEKKGSLFDIQGEFSEEAQQVLVWRELHVMNAGDIMEFYPEVALLSGEVSVFFKIFMVKEGGEEIYAIREVPLKEIRSGEKILFANETDGSVAFNVSFYIQGADTAHVQMGQIHIRRHLLGNSYMIPGGQRLIDEENLGRELFTYFNPGDMRPPLAVYFSGFRTAEGFEGRGIMAGMKCPYILVGDPRLMGGAYYMGSQALEERLVAYIQGKLKLLGFTNHDLILSGLSMGTYGSLYYASDLQPNSVVIGKPLASIGSAMLYVHIRRPGSDPIHDILYTHTGAADEKAAEELDKKFWNKFKKGDYSQTTFAIAYMKQDDIDLKAFPMLTDVLKEISPKSKILYKGLVGRHNDDTPGIVSWFMKQYYSILENTFYRVRERVPAKEQGETQKEVQKEILEEMLEEVQE